MCRMCRITAVKYSSHKYTWMETQLLSFFFFQLSVSLLWNYRPSHFHTDLWTSCPAREKKSVLLSLSLSPLHSFKLYKFQPAGMDKKIDVDEGDRGVETAREKGVNRVGS